MSYLLIPVAPLSRTKSRLRDCFSKELLIELTIAMFKDLALKVSNVHCFDQTLVYCNNSEIIDLANEYGLVGIKEKLTEPRKSFNDVLFDLNSIAIDEYGASRSIFTFLDIILLSEDNLSEVNNLLDHNDLVVCPAIHSAGISILGRKPPDIIPTYFSDPAVPSLVAQLTKSHEKKIKISIYDSFRAGFDIDIKQDLVLAFEYLKAFRLTDSETYKFLESNLKISLKKKSAENNREFEIEED